MPWLDGKGGVAFLDITTCPVCTQDKPVGAFTVREILHIASHVRHPVTDLELQEALTV